MVNVMRKIKIDIRTLHGRVFVFSTLKPPQDLPAAAPPQALKETATKDSRENHSEFYSEIFHQAIRATLNIREEAQSLSLRSLHDAFTLQASVPLHFFTLLIPINSSWSCSSVHFHIKKHTCDEAARGPHYFATLYSHSTHSQKQDAS